MEGIIVNAFLIKDGDGVFYDEMRKQKIQSLFKKNFSLLLSSYHPLQCQAHSLSSEIWE